MMIPNGRSPVINHVRELDVNQTETAQGIKSQGATLGQFNHLNLAIRLCKSQDYRVLLLHEGASGTRKALK